MLQLLIILGIASFLIFVVFAVYIVHETDATRVALKAKYWNFFEFSFQADSPSEKELPPPSNEE